MEPRALRKGFLSTAWHSPWAPRLGKYGAAAAARSPSGILSDAKGARTTLPSAAARASGGEGKGPGSSCGFSEEVTSGGAVLPPASPRPGPLSSFPIGQLRFAGGRGADDRWRAAAWGRARRVCVCACACPGPRKVLWAFVVRGGRTWRDVWRRRAARGNAALRFESRQGAFPPLFLPWARCARMWGAEGPLLRKWPSPAGS